MTPNIAIVHFYNPHWRGMRLWIPLFLLWIPLVLLSPLLFLIVISPWRAIAVFWAISCSLPGTDVDVRAQANHVLVRIL
jgi:hypothetical protein